MFRESPEENAEHGTILFYHGFGESKEAYGTVLSRFAEAGFLAIGIDGIGHGERRYLDFDQRFPPPEPLLTGNAQLEAAFLDVVQQTVAEMPSILDTLIAQKWACPEQIGISGLSFGGLVTYAAVIADKRIQAAVPVVGSPQWKLPRADSPHLHLDLFFPTALLSQTAGKDTNQLPSTVREFHEQLAQYYEQAPERLSSIEYPDSTHDLSKEDWEQAWKAAVDWFETFLLRKSS
jgi:alpha-beta hydrolase superfamily lysophospholipase